MVVSLLQYFVMIPTFINVLAVYAYSNIHDLSWGTKGLDQKEVWVVGKEPSNPLTL